ncbi:MAG: hypothetical protein SF066_10565 [Thermoanaerobaculia bacterium]|nr:hypothetical protein [Thermoanaerobaculia bacterium]
MKKKLLAWISLSCLVLTALPAVAGEETLEKSELQVQMESQGWSQVGSNIFERQLGDGKVEHLGYGPEGLAWTIGELNRQLDRLLGEFELFPSLELAETIEGLSAAISKARGELSAQSRESGGMTAAPLALDGPSCDGVCYSATADAYHLTTQQGVGATAMAKFNNPCGYVGETYAYVYVRATAGTTQTEITRQDPPPPTPKTGTAITSSVSATVAGGSGALPCFSTAASFVQSSQLGFSYSTSDTNDGYCPPLPPPPTCSIIGTNYEYFALNNCRTRTWTANTSGGTYQWRVNGSLAGTASTFSRSICAGTGDFTVSLTVTAANGLSCTSSLYVAVVYEPEPMCGQYLC